MSSTSHRFVDIGANLLDERFTEGSYRGKPRHEPDFDDVLQRAADMGMKHMVLTAGTLKESREAIAKVRELRQTNQTSCQLYCTVGVHPTRCNEFEEAETSADANLEELLALAKDGMTDGVVASVGEMGLDYDRLEFCPKDVQRTHFVRQLKLSEETGLPLFLHNRNADAELYDLLVENKIQWKAGVVHSFDDTAELAQKFIELGLYIGLNGCSLRTAESLEVVKTLPLDMILLETDCPFCDVRRTHAGYEHVKTTFETKQEKKYEKGVQVKGRNEPCNIIQVAEVVAGVKGIPVEELVEACYANSLKLYGWAE
jgi:TatD DNase family protein